MDLHPATKEITGLLEKNNIWFETFTHIAVTTSEEAARVRTGYSIQQGAKALIVRVKKSKADRSFIMLVFPADLRFDDKKIRDITGAKDIRFATQEEISNLTNGIQIGGVPPFGNLFHLEVIADPKLFANEKIVFNAGDRCFSVAMKSEDYKRLVNPRIAEIT